MRSDPIVDAAAALRAGGYARWVSVEMRYDPTRDLVAEIRRVALLLGQRYAGG